MNLYIYLPSPIMYTETSLDILKNMFNVKSVKPIRYLPYKEEIRNAIFWINSHGFERNCKHDFLIQGLPGSNVDKNYYEYMIQDERGNPFIPSKNFTKFFNVKDSIILFDSCYSSEIDLRTLGNWKSNLIFTTGYIPDKYNETWSGLIKAITCIYENLKLNKGIKKLDYETIEKNRDFINNYFESILNKQFKTQFILF